jgi:hypothetical protein
MISGSEGIWAFTDESSFSDRGKRSKGKFADRYLSTYCVFFLSIVMYTNGIITKDSSVRKYGRIYSYNKLFSWLH